MAGKWFGEKPTKCQVCNKPLKGSFIDGATVDGPWAIMDVSCWRLKGRGLGIGRGQRYDLDTLTKMEG
jgi:hypothetical protein